MNENEEAAIRALLKVVDGIANEMAFSFEMQTEVVASRFSAKAVEINERLRRNPCKYGSFAENAVRKRPVSGEIGMQQNV